MKVVYILTKTVNDQYWPTTDIIGVYGTSKRDLQELQKWKTYYLTDPTVRKYNFQEDKDMSDNEYFSHIVGDYKTSVVLCLRERVLE